VTPTERGRARGGLAASELHEIKRNLVRAKLAKERLSKEGITVLVRNSALKYIQTRHSPHSEVKVPCPSPFKLLPLLDCSSVNKDHGRFPNGTVPSGRVGNRPSAGAVSEWSNLRWAFALRTARDCATRDATSQARPQFSSCRQSASRVQSQR
jgi:hypothetical protein